jgi:hypothetical protein
MKNIDRITGLAGLCGKTLEGNVYKMKNLRQEIFIVFRGNHVNPVILSIELKKIN